MVTWLKSPNLDDEGTGVSSLKLGDGSVYGAAGRCWVFRGQDAQDNDDDMKDLSRQMVWTESNGQQFNIRATALFFSCYVTRITPSQPPPFHLPISVQSWSARQTKFIFFCCVKYFNYFLGNFL